MTEATFGMPTLRVAEDVAQVLRSHQIDALVIGAMALAVHNYPRDTIDFDLAVSTHPRVLHEVAKVLRGKGYEVEVRDPAPDDPLGGLIDVRTPDADLVQVINFNNPPAGGFPKLLTDALSSAVPLASTSPLRVVDAYHLIAFKLYAGGSKSKLDILEMLDRNPEIDMERLTTLCHGYRLSRALEAIRKLQADD